MSSQRKTPTIVGVLRCASSLRSVFFKFLLVQEMMDLAFLIPDPDGLVYIIARLLSRPDIRLQQPKLALWFPILVGISGTVTITDAGKRCCDRRFWYYRCNRCWRRLRCCRCRCRIRFLRCRCHRRSSRRCRRRIRLLRRRRHRCRFRRRSCRHRSRDPARHSWKSHCRCKKPHCGL